MYGGDFAKFCGLLRIYELLKSGLKYQTRNYLFREKKSKWQCFSYMKQIFLGVKFVEGKPERGGIRCN